MTTMLEQHGPQAIVLPDESDIDRYIKALEWRRVIIDRVIGWEELAALEKIHRAKIEMLSEELAAIVIDGPGEPPNITGNSRRPWKKLELEGSLSRAQVEVHKCQMYMEQLEREARAWHMKLRAMVDQASEPRTDDA